MNFGQEVVWNLRKAQKSRERMEEILGREVASPRLLGMFFKAAVQAIFLFGSETWVLTPRMGQALGSFQHRVSKRIMGSQPKQQEDGNWEYPPLETVM